MTVLSQRNCQVLEEMITTKLMADYERGKSSRYSIFTNSAHSTLFEVEVREGEFFANLFIGCDATTHIAQTTLRFKFEVAFYNENYEPTTGMYDPVPVHADFYLFYKTLQGYNRMCAGLVAGHGSRVAGEFDTRRLMNYIQGIANAVHAQLPAPTYQRTGANYDQQQQAAAPQLPASSAMTEVSNLNDLVG